MYTIKFAKDSRTLQIFILQKCQTKTTASPAGGIRGSDAVVCFLNAVPRLSAAADSGSERRKSCTLPPALWRGGVAVG